jgi:signal transduction histidine kinase
MLKIKNVLLIFISIFILNNANLCQSNAIEDSILINLNNINEKTFNNTIYYDKVIKLFWDNENKNLLTNKKINAEIKRLEGFLDKKRSSDLNTNFIISHLYLNTIPNEDIIKSGQKYFENNFNKSTGYEYYSLLSLLRELRIPFRNSNKIKEGIEYFNQLENNASVKKDSSALSIIYQVLAGFYNRLSLIENAEYYVLKSADYLNENQKFKIDNPVLGLLGKQGKINRFSVLGNYFLELEEPKSAEKYLLMAINEFNQLKDKKSYYESSFLYLQMAKCKSQLRSDSAAYYFAKTKIILNNEKNVPLEVAHYYMEIGCDFLWRGKLDSVLYYEQKCIDLMDSLQFKIPSFFGNLIPNYYYAKIKLIQNKPEQAIIALTPEIKELKQFNLVTLLLKELKLLSEAYLTLGKNKEAAEVLKELINLKEQIDAEQKANKLISFEVEKKMQQDVISLALLNEQQKSSKKTNYLLFGISVLLGLFAITFGFAIYNKQKTNGKLKLLNEETKATLELLKSTQSQLVQQEKLASLGALTAGIAHEIKNPLNFVNNFSELSSELVDEFIETKDETERQEIGVDLKINLQKINEHGKRADSIVKNMLQHSRGGAGEKQLTDINQLCEEYLNFSFHGKRATDAGFNCEMVKNLDNNLPQINCVTQDISRVILNLINNAFDAVREREIEGKTPNYKPSVTLTTQQINNMISISIKDNGEGIPQNIQEKIFEPFFTTKPAGQGTGLGLSLSYDIVKAHGGEMNLKTKEGEGSEFVIQLPIV